MNQHLSDGGRAPFDGRAQRGHLHKVGAGAHDIENFDHESYGSLISAAVFECHVGWNTD
jgi:hypothetical protein